MFESFTDKKVKLPSGIRLQVRTTSDGPAVLLFPQTHVCWHKVTPRLVDAGYQVVLRDLLGYGDSDKSQSDEKHTVYLTWKDWGAVGGDLDASQSSCT